MPDKPHRELVLNQTWLPRHTLSDIAADLRRRGSTVPLNANRWSAAASQAARTFSLPDDTPFGLRSTKRSTGSLDHATTSIDVSSITSAHAAGDGGIRVCICPPDPKIPRPRNAFILYRQHHQASVVAQHPHLANPEISKIIGEQWQNENQETKNKWKSLAEDEKLRHQLQYPGYRYQPKRSDRRGSLVIDPLSASEHARCVKCGGRTILTPSTPHPAQSQRIASVPPTPQSAIGPDPRGVSELQELSLQSPAAHQISRAQAGSIMSPGQVQPDERGDGWPGTPDWKRRRMNYMTDQPKIPPNTPTPKSAAQNASVGPGTPFPFRQEQGLQSYQYLKRPYPNVSDHGRRESLPPMRSVVNPPSAMAPPPRPIMGYQQHRLAQGHTPHDRSLTLPPLQTGRPPDDISPPLATGGNGRIVDDHVTPMPFRYKITVLGRIARPAVMNEDNLRGPLLAVEGDDADAVKELGHWLAGELAKGTDLSVHLYDGPEVVMTTNVNKPMIQYHRLIAEWLARSDEIIDSITRRSSVAEIHPRIDEAPLNGERRDSETEATPGDSNPTSTRIDPNHSQPAISSPKAIPDKPHRPVGVIPNFSLYASNVFACRIPVEANEAYTASDHWSWTATQWRGVVGPDLTIYVCDSNGPDTGRPSVEMMEEGNLFLVKRVDCGKGYELEASAARRLAFEVSEWVRAFGSTAPGSH